jgi:dTDP-4-amino-4,6-dideoxygalactose transaminase
MIPVARPVTGEEEVEAIRRPLLSGWVTQGPEVEAFEREFAAYVGAPHAVAVSNCTTALHLALRAVGVGSGDEVITVSHSFIATANAVRYCGARPVFVDVQPDTFNIDPPRIEAAISPRTRAILCVHQVGMPCDIPAILAIARRHGLAVVEDAACAAGSEILIDGAWQRIGRSHGDIACFSFHPRKLLTTGDGGMLTTRNPELDRLFRRWRQHSMSVSDAQRHAASQVVFEAYDELGFNYRMTDLQAAVGRVQLQRLPGIVERRRARAERRALLADTPGLALPREPEWARSNWQSFTVRLPDGIDQHAVMQTMLEAGVATRRAVMCSHREAAYRAAEPWACGPSPARGCDHSTGRCARLLTSERIQDRGIILPLYDQMTDADQQRVAEALRIACRAAAPARAA